MHFFNFPVDHVTLVSDCNCRRATSVSESLPQRRLWTV